MSKTKLERGRFYGKVKTVTARRDGRVVGQMPFDQLVNEVAEDPNFSLAHGSKRQNPSLSSNRVELPARITRQWLASLSPHQLNAVLKAVDDESQASFTPAEQRTCDNRSSMILDEIESRRKAS